MVETYRTTSKINKQQSVKGSKNCDISSRIKRQIITDRKTHTHKHTHKTNSLACRVELRSRKGDRRHQSRSANFKGVPGKVLWKNQSRRKKEHHENGSAPHRTSCCTVMKHGRNKNIRRPRCCVGSKGYLDIRTQSSKCIVMRTMNYPNQSSKGTLSANTY